MIGGKVEVGDWVIYVDPKGREHDALVTATWGQWEDATRSPQPGEYAPANPERDSVNLVYVNPDVNSRDDYGRQISRTSSTPPQSAQSAHGNYYKLATE